MPNAWRLLAACCCIDLNAEPEKVSTEQSPTMSGSHRDSAPSSSIPAIFAQFASEDFVQGGGVVIFHLASERVVICSAEDRRGRKYYFLPKGRRDAGENAGRGAEREGYEEVWKTLGFATTVEHS